jgi:iron(II)-dependent oxidoreductase
MSTNAALTAGHETRSWARRFLHSLWAKPAPAAAGTTAAPSARREENGDASVAQRLISEQRFLFVLLKEAEVDESDTVAAWRLLEDEMALVPYGVVPVPDPHGGANLVEVPAFYLDRCAVTNRQFQRFVRAGGYENLEIWPREVWPGLMRFTDRSGQPGPRDWENGRYPSGLGDHPVVGVCWYEALAFARWVGKRLPSAVEWQKAGGWPEQLSGGAINRYPWGNVFDPGRANLWASGVGHTVPVREFAKGATLNGIYQMTGNVWEWLDDPLHTIPSQPGERLETDRPLRRIVGGAFDTYFANEATCHFLTGQPELDRRGNIGFRCAVSIDRLRPTPGTNDA